MNAYEFEAWTCTMRLVVIDPAALRPAAADLTALLARVEQLASWFRPDSALSVANRRAGRPSPVPKLVVELVGAALDAAAATDGVVDPTLCGAWRRVRLDRASGLLSVPPGCSLDLGATAKAWTADHAARTLATRYETPVLVALGGDVAVAGDAEWTVRVAERAGEPGQNVTVRRGGLTTSTTVVRGLHIADPRTGKPASGPWRTASVAADSALRANIASTAAIVLGAGATRWLAEHGHAARLVAADGSVHTVGTWPAEGCVAA